jgi:hypothetical protein
LRTTTVYEGPQGKIPMETRYDDYREVGSVKMAFDWTRQTPVGDTVGKVTAVRHNPEITTHGLPNRRFNEQSRANRVRRPAICEP